jgi:hypothetical protein
MFLFVYVNAFAQDQTKPAVLGLEIGMNKEEAVKQLQKIGKKERNERKGQEIWNLIGDAHYSYIIIAFNKENKVRFITAKAREGGKPVRYSDVINIKKARQDGAVNNYKYVMEMPSRGKDLGYRVVARGQNKDYLTYYSIEEFEVINAK